MGKRLEWLDALRGFTMILVVAYHVGQMSFGIDLKASASMPFVVLFRMPLFFFVSGFLAWKADMLWTPVRLGMMIWKKVKVQLLPTLVFLSVFIVVRRPHFWDGMVDALQRPTKCGYWFTWALLIMFVVYYLFDFLTRAKRRPTDPPSGRSIGIWLLWLVSLILYETVYMPRRFTFPQSDWMQWSSLVMVIQYMHFFVFGNIVRRYWDKSKVLMDSRWLFCVIVVLTFFCTADSLKWHTLRGEWANLPRTLAMYGLMSIVVMTFRHYATALSTTTWAGRTLQYVGRRTLDIYLLHYILLPRLPQVGKWINAHEPGFLAEQGLTIMTALVVVAACCLVSHVLRVSPVLKKYLFGRG